MTLSFFKISARGHKCCLCEQPFKAGNTYHSSLRLDEEEAERKDYCMQCWSNSKQHMQGNSWKGVISIKKEKDRKEVSKDQIVWERLKEIKETSILEQKTRYMLVLYLERRKILSKQKKISYDKKIACYEHIETGEVICISPVTISLDEMKDLELEIQNLF